MRAQGLRGKPIVLITGANGNLGRSVARALMVQYQIVGLDREAQELGSESGPDGVDFPVIAVDLSADDSVISALQVFRDAYGSRIASVVHLAAYFDFTGEDNPLYQSVNVEGTRRLLHALQGFEVAQFLYPSTMLVHAPCNPGEHIDETQPIHPALATMSGRPKGASPASLASGTKGSIWPCTQAPAAASGFGTCSVGQASAPCISWPRVSCSTP